VLFARLHPVISLLGLLFLVVVLAQSAATPGQPLHVVLQITTWVLWAVFVAEYLVRLVLASHRWQFMRRTWWRLALLAVPALSIIRALLIFRVARPTRVLLAAVRGTRSAGSRLSSRLGLLGLVTAIVVFVAADLVHSAGAIEPYGRALHASAKAAVAGETMPSDDWLVAVVDVVLSIYAVGVFAALAGTVGSYFVDRRDAQRATADDSLQP
jgi:voltage-gated potassium channel